MGKVRNLKAVLAGLALVCIVVLLVALPRLTAYLAHQRELQQEQARQAEVKRLMNSDPVKFEMYVKQVAIAADVIGQGEQDISGPCLAVSGFENGVGDPPPETKSCTIHDPGTQSPTVQLVLKDGRTFDWPPGSNTHE